MQLTNSTYSTISSMVPQESHRFTAAMYPTKKEQKDWGKHLDKFTSLWATRFIIHHRGSAELSPSELVEPCKTWINDQMQEELGYFQVRGRQKVGTIYYCVSSYHASCGYIFIKTYGIPLVLSYSFSAEKGLYCQSRNITWVPNLNQRKRNSR